MGLDYSIIESLDGVRQACPGGCGLDGVRDIYVIGAIFDIFHGIMKNCTGQRGIGPRNDDYGFSGY